MLGVVTTGILDDNKGKKDWASRMLEQARGVSALVIAMEGKVGNKGVVRNFAGLGEAIHAFPDSDIGMALVNKGAKFVLVKNGFGDEGYRYHHVFVAVHGGI
jgi:hypothetical protein